MNSAGGIDSDRVAALAALYTSERADQQTHMNVALSLIAGAVVYVGLIASQFTDIKRSYLWAVAAPAPIWIVAAFHVLLISAVLTRNQSIRILEGHLAAAADLGVPTSEIGSERGRRIMDIDKQPWALKVQTIVTYAGILSSLIAFTFVCLWNAYKYQDGWTPPIIIGIAAYIVLATALLLAWKAALREL